MLDPFSQPPFKHYIQSPLGLVPKDGGKKTRLIFHLSHPRDSGKSVNENTPKEKTTVSYPSFDEAVKLCVKHGKNCYMGKSDLTSAFRHICMSRRCWKFLVMKAQSPKDGKFYYFVDKCMPFGASISCAIFQAFSNAISHIVKTKNNEENINYLDDFFFVALAKELCNKYLTTFIQTCNRINFPVSMEKTFWANQIMTFLGLLIDTQKQLVCVPTNKIELALKKIRKMLNARPRKTTLGELQQLCGFLNFIGKCIVPGRAFTRRLYTFGNGLTKENHHLYVKKEMRLDLEMWETFLTHPTAFCRPFFEFSDKCAQTMDWYTDAAKAKDLGCGGYHKNEWFMLQWDEEFLELDPSINYLELFAVTVSVLLWAHKYKNQTLILFCDNMSVVQMINNNSSKCQNCMILIRILVLHSLVNNVKITAKHVKGVNNVIADMISRMKYKEFRNYTKNHNLRFDSHPREIPEILQSPQKLWQVELPKKTNKLNRKLTS